MTYTFVVPDIHGRFESLRLLLRSAGILDESDNRKPGVNLVAASQDREENERLASAYEVVSIGDLANATFMDQAGDEECLLKAREWFDALILGNHESGYLFDGMGFNGYHPAPHLRSLYNSFRRDGIVVPTVQVGDTLLTHAGVHEYLNFETADEAFDVIWDVWDNYREYAQDWGQKFYSSLGSSPIEIPKAMILDGVSSKRGGSTPFGGILWSDWGEPKNTNFSQVMGHTPIKSGPVMHTYRSKDIFHLNIDCAAKKGMTPWGVWLDEQGRLFNYVTVSEELVAV